MTYNIFTIIKINPVFYRINVIRIKKFEFVTETKFFWVVCWLLSKKGPNV